MGTGGVKTHGVGGWELVFATIDLSGLFECSGCGIANPVLLAFAGGAECLLDHVGNVGIAVRDFVRRHEDCGGDIYFAFADDESVFIYPESC